VDDQETILATRPLTWKKRRTFVHGNWKLPFVFIEWLGEKAVFWLKRSAFIELVGIIAGLSVIVAAWQYVQGAEDRKKARQFQAWQVINLAHGKGGSGGRIAALRDLLMDGVDLSGVDLSKAWLQGVILDDARLTYANFDTADLRNATLAHANLAVASGRGASFYGANLRDATLSDGTFQGALLQSTQLCEIHASSTDFRDADFRGSNLYGAWIVSSDLRGARLSYTYNWRNIANMALTNIYGLRDAPDGFEQFALDSLGAVSMKSRGDWQKFLFDTVATRPYFDRAHRWLEQFGRRESVLCRTTRRLEDDSDVVRPQHFRDSANDVVDTTYIIPRTFRR
jgi:Pentapeptide repeats (8 copies)